MAAARRVLESEAKAILAVSSRIDERFARAVQSIVDAPGKVVVTGIGKSGRVGEKIAATLSSTGTPAVFLHAAEAAHGDIGLCAPGDVVVLVSKSGSTAELCRLVPALRALGCKLIGILGNPRSRLASDVDIALDASVACEADPLNLAPTASSTVAMALGDALAVALMEARNFTPEHFAERHPSGQLGRNLNLSVADVMHRGDEVAWARPADPLRTVIIAMTQRPLGASCVVDADGGLAGLITDGDLRRALEKHDDIRPLQAADLMNRHPTTVGPAVSLREALRLMEDRQSQISVLPVLDPADSRCLGLIRLHDIYRADV